MAALRGTIRGDRTRANSDGRSTRLADRSLAVHADTWHTFSEINIDKDGSGSVRVTQNGRTILSATWSAESDEWPRLSASLFGDRESKTVEVGEAERPRHESHDLTAAEERTAAAARA